MAQAVDNTLPPQLQQILSAFPAELVNMRVEIGKGAPSRGWNLFTWGSPADENQGPPAYMPGDHSLFETTDAAAKEQIVVGAAQESPQLDRAIGSIIGMGVGDWVGHPMEFVDVGRCKEAIARRPHFVLSEFEWYNEKNAFALDRGMWTDDASMGLCMADSLIIKNGYDGSDMRTRFWNWWNKGYNNAFRKATRSGSVGLGGNISKSLYSLELGAVPTARFEAEGEDSGNGSLMRLTPVPIFFSHDIEAAKKFARESSYTTHPGSIAAEACAFMSFIIVRAIHCPTNPADDVRGFLDAMAAEYDAELQAAIAELETDAEANASQIGARRKIRQLIASQEEESSTEFNWNWRTEEFQDCILRGCQNRGRKYNGYPVSPGYWGAYCMDGLAMGLNAVYYSTSFATAVERCVNFLGDADSTGSICGQLAGAIYGFKNLHERDPDKQMIERLADWDDYEFGLRGVLLFKLGPTSSSQEVSDDTPIVEE